MQRQKRYRSCSLVVYNPFVYIYSEVAEMALIQAKIDNQMITLIKVGTNKSL